MDALLDGPLMFTPVELPEGKRYRVEGRQPVRDSNTKANSGLKLKAILTGFEHAEYSNNHANLQ